MSENLKKLMSLVKYYSDIPSEMLDIAERCIVGSEYPAPGEYIYTGPQVGNPLSLETVKSYFGHVAQVRLQQGQYGTNLLFIRHLDGSLKTHENQCFYRVKPCDLPIVQAAASPGINPSMEDYSQEYTINGQYPANGAIVEYTPDGYKCLSPSPSIQMLKTNSSNHIQFI